MKEDVGVTKLFSVIVLLFCLSGCVTYNDNGCFKQFGSSTLKDEYLTIKLDKKLKRIKIPNCKYDNEGNKYFAITVGVNDKEIQRKEGNTVLINMTSIFPADKIDEKEIIDLINNVSKDLIDVKNTRFKKEYTKESDLIHKGNKICKIFSASVRDYEATNKPKEQDYLLQNDLHEMCFIKQYNQIMSLGISFRMTKKSMETFWNIDILRNLMGTFSSNITMNDDKKNLDTILEDNYKEIEKILNIKTVNK
ncbi:MAG: hypothetical protein IJ853_00300 [Rickettsiales bacterium]|nr:hypothetical protein [Rickettsiales bacterium]